MVDEMKLAETATVEAVTIYDRIIKREIPSTIVYEDDQVS